MYLVRFEYYISRLFLNFMVPFLLLIQNLVKVAKFNYIIIYVLIISSFPSKELNIVNKAQRMP